MSSSQEKAAEKDVHIVYKNLGETPLQCLQRFVKDRPEYVDSSVTYAGRLDPMAEGLLVLLTNERVNFKESFLDLPKTYEAEVLWGVETDTLDLLGRVVSKLDSSIVEEEEIREYFKNSSGKFEQVYPVFSSRPVNGKPLLQWAREGRLSEIDIPKHTVELFEARFIERRSIKKIDLLKEVEEKISLVIGDFRQTEILEKWQEVLGGSKVEEFVVDKIELKVSSGFYVRQFVTDLAKSLGTVATTFFIKRLQIGEYTIADIV